MTRSFIKTLKSALLAVGALAAIAFAAPASACYGYQCNNTPAPAPTPSNFSFNLTSGVAFEGMGTGSFVGNHGGVDVVKEGFGVTESTFNLAGNGCGVTCANLSYTAMGATGERVGVNAWASGNNVRVLNGGSAATLMQGGVSITKIPGTP